MAVPSQGMVAAEMLRKLKDDATRAYQQRHYAQAAELYRRVAEREPHQGDWLQRAGESLRHDGKIAAAADTFAAAATRYNDGGFLLKAIAMCKLVLQIDPAHPAAAAQLAALNVRREQSSAPAGPSLVRIAAPTPNAALGQVALGSALPSRASTQFAGSSRAAPMEIDLSTLFDREQAQPLLRLDDLGELPLASNSPAAVPVKLPPVPLFSSLPPDELRHLIDRLVLRSLTADERVIRQGEAGSSLFVVIEGELEVTVTIPGQTEPLAIGALHAGDFFGELALLTDLPRSASVTARAPTQLFEIERSVAWELIERQPEVLRLLVQFFRDRMLERLFRTAPLFAMLSPDDARALAARFVFLEAPPGTSLVTEGARSPGLFVLLCGAADVVDKAGHVLKSLSPGEVFGEMSLLQRSPAMASIVARAKCWVLELPAKDFQETALSYPQLLDYVSQLSGDRADENEIDLRLAAI